MRMPGACEQELRISRTDRQIRNADLAARIENLGPMRSTVCGLVDAAFFVGTIGVTKRADIDDIRVSRVDHDPADLARVLQTDVGPSSAAINRFVNPVARREIRTNVGLARPNVDGLRVRWGYNDGADRADGLVVEDWRPNSSSVGRFPDASVDPTKIKCCGVARDASHGNHSTSAKWADETPFQTIH